MKKRRNRSLHRKCLICIREIDNRSKSGLCVSCCRRGKLNPFYNKKHTLKTREVMKIKAKLKDKNKYYKFSNSKEMIEKREATKRTNWSKYTLEEKHKRLQNFIRAGRKKKGTRIEKIIREVLNQLGMIEGQDYITNKYIGGYNVDILVNSYFIIECYGDYWHKNPQKYKATTDRIKREKDLEREKYLIGLGYTFIYFWETDIINNLEYVKQRLSDFFRSYLNLFEWESCSCM